MVLLFWGAQNWAELSMCAHQCGAEGRITSLYLLAALHAAQDVLVQGHIAGSCLACSPGPPGPSLQICFPSSQPHGELDCSSPGGGLTPPFLKLHHVPVCPFLQPAEIPRVYEAFVPALHHLNTLSHPPDH